MGNNQGCLLGSLIAGSPVEKALSKNDFDALKRIFSTAVNSRSKKVVSNLRLNRVYNDETVIQTAVKFQRADVVELLLRLGANADLTVAHSLSALTRAIIINNEEIFEILMQYNADPNVSSFDGVSPLSYSIIVNRPFAFDCLLAHPKILVNAQGVAARSALHHACNCRLLASLDFMERLLQAGARVDVKDSTGCTPLHLAIKSPNKIRVICEHLRQRKQLEEILSCRDFHGLNVLHLSVMKEEFDSTCTLLENGANFGVIPQGYSEQVLTAAISSNNSFILQHLLLSLPDPTCCYFSESISPAAGLLDMALTMRRFEVAMRLRLAACLPRSPRPRSKRIAVSIAENFNSPASLQSFARLSIRRTLQTCDAHRYENAVCALALPYELAGFLLYSDIVFVSNHLLSIPSTSRLVPDLTRLRNSQIIEDE